MIMLSGEEDRVEASQALASRSSANASSNEDQWVSAGDDDIRLSGEPGNSAERASWAGDCACVWSGAVKSRGAGLQMSINPWIPGGKRAGWDR